MKMIAVTIRGFLALAAFGAVSPAVSGLKNPQNIKIFAETAAARILPRSAAYNGHDVILRELSAADKAADDVWRALRGRAEYDACRAAMRAKFAESVGGLDFDRTPPVAKITGTVRRDGYRVEKVLFESRPGVYVTALVFVPDAGRFAPPYRAILLPCGHSNDGKAYPAYQRGAVLGAREGFLVMVYDPISQGEREQVPGGIGCGPHNRYGTLAALLGRSTARQRILDGMRSIDYLYTRDDVRKDGVGCMGNSGGGTMTAELASLDPRIVAACPSCYISTVRAVCAAIGPQDAEQHFFGQYTFGFNHAALVLCGGNAVRIHCAVKDFFPIAGSRETYALVRETVKNCGLDPARYGMLDVPGPHGWKESTRASSVQWMRRWLAGDESVPPIDVEACRALDIGFKEAGVDCGLPRGQANVTPGGRVKDLPGFRSIYDYLKDDLAAAEKARPKRSAAELAPVVARRAGIRPLDELGVSVKTVGEKGNLPGGAKAVREVYSFGDGQLVPAVTFVPPGDVKGAILVVDDRPDRAIHRERILDAVSAGKAIMVADLACLGETGKRRHRFYAFGTGDEGPAVMMYMLGKSLVGVRAEEIIALSDALKRRFGAKVRIVPHGRPCIPAAHAFAVRPDLVGSVECVRSPASWATSVRTSGVVPNANVVNGALLEYDWTELVSPR